jgi:hypothetical protein
MTERAVSGAVRALDTHLCPQRPDSNLRSISVVSLPASEVSLFAVSALEKRLIFREDYLIKSEHRFAESIICRQSAWIPEYAETVQAVK